MSGGGREKEKHEESFRGEADRGGIWVYRVESADMISRPSTLYSSCEECDDEERQL